MISLSGISKSYGERAVLCPLSLEVASGSSLALVGPSGCGKSTLLRIVLGLIQPDQGQVRLNGQVLERGNARETRLKMGYVIQDGGLFPHLTARQNVGLVARQEGWGATRMQDRVLELAHLVQLPADLMDRFPAQLSGGQRQRVGIMRALMLDPEVLLMDEPMGALDPLVRSALQKDLREIFRQLAKTVILVTHDMAEAAFLGDEIVVMQDGIILQRGTLQQLLDQPANEFVAEFLRAQHAEALC